MSLRPTVTFLLTDIEGSTRLWEDHLGVMKSGLADHNCPQTDRGESL
jgi:class 3 adenylate cyclase